MCVCGVGGGGGGEGREEGGGLFWPDQAGGMLHFVVLPA